jgi:cysteine desulfuration protein SufE
MLPDLDTILDSFELIDDWEERYRYIIELGRLLPDFDEAQRQDHNKVQGCASQVWLVTRFDPVLSIQGDSDAHIVRGLIALLVAFYAGKTPQEALSLDPLDLFKNLGLSEHLSPQRSNGVKSMIGRIQRDAGMAL